MHPRKGNFRFLSLFLIALVTLMAAGSALAQPSGPKGFTATPLTPGEQFSSTTAKDGRPNALRPQKNGLVSVIVKLRADSLAAHTVKVSGTLGAQSNAKGDGRPDVTSSASQQYLSQLNGQINTFASAAQQAIPSARVTQKYDIVIGGVAMLVPADKVSTLSTLPGVAAVYPDTVLHLDTDRTPTFIGATKLWADLGGQANAGEHVIVGVLDTGVWPEHPSFSDPDPGGKPYSAPPPPAPGTTRQCEFSGG